LPREIRNVRERAKILEQCAAARRARQARHLALRILEVTEHQRTRRARLGAGRLEITILAWPSAARMRCTQNVHFSMTPTVRTETSGLSCRWSGFGQLGLKKLKNRTLYGQAFAQ
jgi:hypothetical protein